MKKSRFVIFIVLCILLFNTLAAEAVCKSRFINPLTDICWQCVFPLVIGGVKLIQSDIKPDLDMDVSSPVCLCKYKKSVVLGLSAGFFEPARLAETVKDPYCFPIVGASTGDSANIGFLGGTHTERTENKDQESVFQQAHWFIFPAFAIIDMFVDLPCISEKSFDIAYITEIDPLWNDDSVAFLINPEVLLFANPLAQISCAADAIASTLGKPINPLFWCAGAWGSAYPLTGHVNSDSYIQGNALLAARMIFKLGREGMLWDTGVDVCGSVLTPIWRKSHYRMHIMKPVRDTTCHPIGKSSILWGTLKNPPFSAGGNAGDNFAWMFFRKNVCCLGYKFP